MHNYNAQISSSFVVIYIFRGPLSRWSRSWVFNIHQLAALLSTGFLDLGWSVVRHWAGGGSSGTHLIQRHLKGYETSARNTISNRFVLQPSAIGTKSNMKK